MDINKISRKYTIDNFFKITNKKVKLQYIILRVVKKIKGNSDTPKKIQQTLMA